MILGIGFVLCWLVDLEKNWGNFLYWANYNYIRI